MTGAIAMGTSKITGLGTPTDSADATTKAYVDGVAQGLDVKASVKAASTENVNLSSPPLDGNFVSIGGVTMDAGQRVLLKDQTSATQNGIYVVAGEIGSFTLTRSEDANSNGEFNVGAFTFVEDGTHAGKGFVVTASPFLGMGNVVWSQFSGAGTFVAGNGLTLTGNSFSIDTTITTDLSTAQTLTNKTLTSPTVSGLTLSDGSIVLEGATADAHETTITVTDPTEDRTITLPNATGTVALTNNKLDAFAATSSSELAGVISDETGTGALVFANTPTLTTPVIGAATGTSLALPDALLGSATATVGTSATTVDSFLVSQYTAAKYVVQLKKSGNIEVIEILVAVDGDNNVYLTEYANVQSNGELGTTNAVYLGASLEVVLQVTAAAADTSVKVSKTYIEA
jgi:hypothetical protein